MNSGFLPPGGWSKLHAVYKDGELCLPDGLDLVEFKNARIKVVVRVPKGPERLLSREEQENLREKLLAADPAERKVKIEHDPDLAAEPTPLATARSAEEKLRAYWAMKGAPPPEHQERLVAKLTVLEKVVLCERDRS